MMKPEISPIARALFVLLEAGYTDTALALNRQVSRYETALREISARCPPLSDKFADVDPSDCNRDDYAAYLEERSSAQTGEIARGALLPLAGRGQ